MKTQETFEKLRTTNEKQRKTYENKGTHRKTEGINSGQLLAHGVVVQHSCNEYKANGGFGPTFVPKTKLLG